MPREPTISSGRLYSTAFLLGVVLFLALVAGPFFQHSESTDDLHSYNEGLLGLQAEGLLGQLLALLKNSTPSFSQQGGQWVAETSFSVTQTVTYTSVGQEDLGEDGQKEGTLEQFLFPMVDERWGVGNQLQEFISAAYTARLLNRTLCLANPLAQPQEHKGGDELSKVPKWSDHFSLDSLSSVVRISPVEECVQKCDGLLQELYFMETYFQERGPTLKYPSWEDFVGAYGLKLERKVPPQQSSSILYNNTNLINWFHTASAVQCIGTTTFLGLRFREPWRLFYSNARPSPKVSLYADRVQQHLLGSQPYLALHWRVEELRCRDKPKDHLCFVRCNYGALWAPSFIPPKNKWDEVAADFDPSSCEDPLLAVVTGVTVDDLVKGVVSQMQASGLKDVFLSTDGFIRGPEMCLLVEEAISALLQHDEVRQVVVLEHCKDLAHSAPTNQSARVVTNEGAAKHAAGHYTAEGAALIEALLAEHASFISLVEQEISQRAEVFLGTSESSWSMQVWQSREYSGRGGDRAEAHLHRKQEVKQEEAGTAPFVDESGALLSDEQLELLSGGACFFRQNFPVLEVEGRSILGNSSDHWVDYLACEERLRKGGKCRAECSSTG